MEHVQNFSLTIILPCMFYFIFDISGTQKLSFLGRDSNTDLAGYIDGLFCSFSSVS